MLIKNIILAYVSLNTCTYIFILFLFNISIIFFLSSIRYKLFWFLIIILSFSSWGILFNLDGFFLILIVTELTVFLFLIMAYIQIYENIKLFNNSYKLNLQALLSLIIFLVIIHNSNNLILSIEYLNFYYGLNGIVSVDFFILFYLLFNVIPLVTTLSVLIISLFSLFFILIFFILKQLKQKKYEKSKIIMNLRKQNFLKQSRFLNKIYIFQDNVPKRIFFYSKRF